MRLSATRRRIAALALTAFSACAMSAAAWGQTSTQGGNVPAALMKKVSDAVDGDRTRLQGIFKDIHQNDLPPLNATSGKLVESVFRGENGHEKEAVHRTADPWVFEGS